MSKSQKVMFNIVLIVIITFVSYTLWDNYRIKVVQEDIEIRNLPKELDGFKILQITDLHEEEFGEDQHRLLEKIHSLDYDVIVFTGDMLDNNESGNYDPFYTVLENIDQTKPALVVPGNADAPSYQYSPEFRKSEFVIGIEERGAIYLESLISLKKNEKEIHFVNFELAIIENPNHIGKSNGSFQALDPSNEQYQTYQEKLWEQMIQEDVLHSSDIVVALNHFPVPDARVDYIVEDPNTVWRDFELIIAGHYHGGQIRLPFIGAVFIPDPWYEPNSFFPPQDRVKGLWEYNQTKQYVSAGLGTSDAIPFLKFRLFNPSEINVITLKSK